MLQNTKQAKVRDSSMELLRIIAMIMIVFHHFGVHGGFQWGADISITRFWFNFIVMGGKLGVNIFVFISGYYLITSDAKSVELTKIIKFIGQVLFYSAAAFIVGKLTGVGDLGLRSLVKAFLPITYSQYWFASTYFVLYLMHPYLNKLLRSMDKSMYQKFLHVLIVCWSVIPTFTASSYQGNPLLWCATLYSISGYIRLYGLNPKFTAKHYFVSFLACSVLTYFSSVVFVLLGSRWDVFAANTGYFYSQESVPTFISSLCLFMTFASIKINYRKWINIAASTTFGVYLIHDNSILRQFLWLKWFQNAQYQNSLLLIPYSIIVVAVVFAACSFIEFVRQRVIEKPFMLILRSCMNKKTIMLPKLSNMLKDFVFGK